MEDAKIDAIAREVLTALKNSRAADPPLPRRGPDVSASQPITLHPSLHLLSVTGGVVGSPCIIEPDKPCVGSLKCRTFGH